MAPVPPPERGGVGTRHPSLCNRPDGRILQTDKPGSGRAKMVCLRPSGGNEAGGGGEDVVRGGARLPRVAGEELGRFIDFLAAEERGHPRGTG